METKNFVNSMKKVLFLFLIAIIVSIVAISWYLSFKSFSGDFFTKDNFKFIQVSSDKYQSEYYDSLHKIEVIELKMYQEDIFNYKSHNKISYRTQKKYENLLYEEDRWREPKKRIREANRKIFMLGSNTKDTTNVYRSLYILYSESLTETKAIEVLKEDFSCDKLLIKDQVESISKTYGFEKKNNSKSIWKMCIHKK